MSDWKSIAKARDIALAGKDLDVFVQPLEALEEIFRPLVKDLSPELEPVLEFRVEADSE